MTAVGQYASSLGGETNPSIWAIMSPTMGWEKAKLLFPAVLDTTFETLRFFVEIQLVEQGFVEWGFMESMK